MSTFFIVPGVVLALVFTAYAIYLLDRRRRKTTFRHYGHTIERHDLGRYGSVEFARWLHPRVKDQALTESQVDALREYVSEGDFVIDIGAHMGDTTVPLAVAAGASGTTLAIEPNPYVFPVLEANAALNRDRTRIVPRCFAATDVDGRFTFLYSDASFCNGGNLGEIADQRHRHTFPLEVEGKNLEQILRSDFAALLDRLTYVKIDAEGYDKDIIRSLKNILVEYRPVLVTEVLKKLNDEERAEMYDTLVDCGYTPYLQQKTPPLRGQAIARGDMNTWRHFDILALPDANTGRPESAALT